MIIYSKEPLNVMMRNILLLDDPATNGYVYVNKETYDQALSLSITYNDDIGRVKGTISGKGMLNWQANKSVGHVISLCSEKFKSPLNMLVPYLAYTIPIGVEWPEEDDEIIKMAYGILHQMSQFINFYMTALTPAGTKADLTIPKNVIMAYEDSWKAQLDTLGQCVVSVPVYVDRVIREVVETPVTTPTVPAEPAVPNYKEPEVKAEQNKLIAIEPEDNDDITVSRTAESTKPEPEEKPVEENHDAEPEVTEAIEESNDSDDGEEEEEDLEAKILAMMKSIEEAPAEQFAPKEEAKPVEEKKEEKKEEQINFGESGSINMTDREIAAGNRRLLADYDI